MAQRLAVARCRLSVCGLVALLTLLSCSDNDPLSPRTPPSTSIPLRPQLWTKSLEWCGEGYPFQGCRGIVPAITPLFSDDLFALNFPYVRGRWATAPATNTVECMYTYPYTSTRVAGPYPATNSTITITFPAPVSYVNIHGVSMVSGPWYDQPDGCSSWSVPQSAQMNVYGRDGELLATVPNVPNVYYEWYQSQWDYNPNPLATDSLANTIYKVELTPDGGSHLAVDIYYSRYAGKVPCLTGDSLLDEWAVRQGLKMSWDSTNVNDPVLANRRERGGFILARTGGELSFVPDFDPTDKPCRADLIPNFAPGDSLVAEMHMHPFHPWEETTTLHTAGICGDTLPPGGHTYHKPGPSAADVRRVMDDNTNSIVMDTDSIFLVPKGSDTANYMSTTKRYPRFDAAQGCTRP